MPSTFLNLVVGFLLLSLCTACNKLSELQNAYLKYDVCTATDTRFKSLKNIAPNVRVEVVKPLKRAPNAEHYLAGEVHYYDQYNQLLAIVIYGLGPKETWAIKEVFEGANATVAPSGSTITSTTGAGSSICRFEQSTSTSAVAL